MCAHREVQVLKKAAAKAEKSKKPVAIVSTTRSLGSRPSPRSAPDLPPVPGRYASFARDHEYKRLLGGTLKSLLAGIDLLTGKVHALVRERHRSREFIEFLKLLDAAYPASTAIKLILDNHSRTHFEGNPSLARHPAARPLRQISPSRPPTAPGST